ncbi:hypothetical protein EV175_000311 [Coemansia sp. RSA 1933]|nr:hypothetical protein EV175_000311 [Coemansia sp. RSA 1933]
MPTYQVVRCASDQCGKYQSQQQKKTNKWSCVVCGLKQSLKRVYFESTRPKECREAVMEMNMQRGKAQAEREQAKLMVPVTEHLGKPGTIEVEEKEEEESKWARYKEDDQDEEGDTAVAAAVEEGGGVPLDKYNRIVVGQVEKKQVKRKVRPVVSVDGADKEESATTRYSPYLKTGGSKAAVRRSPSPLPKEASVPEESPRIHQIALKARPKEKETLSKWGQFAGSESESESE